MGGGVEGAEAVERPERVDGGDRAVIGEDEFVERVGGVPVLAFDEQPLGDQAPDLGVAAEGGHQGGHGRAGERRHLFRGGAFGHDAVDAAALVIAQRVFVGAADAGLRRRSRRVCWLGVGLCWMMKFCQSASQMAPSGPTSA